MNDISPYLKQIPEPLQPKVNLNWKALCEAYTEQHIPFSEDADFMQALLTVMAGSEFFAEVCRRQPKFLNCLWQNPAERNRINSDGFLIRLEKLLININTQDQLSIVLREFRQYEMMRIIWRDLLGQADLNEVTHALSALADACIIQSVAKLSAWHSQKMGVPYDVNGREMSLIVLGLGKLGGCELNLSSDIDIICCYAQEGELRAGHTYHNYFNTITQRLVQVLNTTMPQGLVFRVDMRLRPYGESGPLVMTFSSLEQYYQEQGRGWERYAMIKARVITGHAWESEILMRMIKAFVYRRYVDYGALNALRDMKTLVAQEVRRKSIEDNIKLGPGGIREIEFIGQAYQLMRGGREPLLQHREILMILDHLVTLHLFTPEESTQLKKAYIFLRQIEHRLQAVQDQQTHRLPTTSIEQCRLAYMMNSHDWPSLQRELTLHRNNVQQQFEQLAAIPPIDVVDDLQAVCLGTLDHQQALIVLEQHGFIACEHILTKLEAFMKEANLLSPVALMRIKQLLPSILFHVSKNVSADINFSRVLDICRSIMKRSAYFALLIENPIALQQLIKLCAASAWISDQLAQFPNLLDELLDPNKLIESETYEQLKTDLNNRLRGTSFDDIELPMHRLREFKQIHTLRIVAADITGQLSITQVSDKLSMLAEVILQAVLVLAWNKNLASQKVTLKEYADFTAKENLPFGVIAYGKLGGYELSYISDLDLVFLYGKDTISYLKNINPDIVPGEFVARLAQRVIHYLSTRTTAGILYPVDTRLRPSDAAGLLVSTIENFKHYQLNKAWLWEHQALIRARIVYGSKVMKTEFDKIRWQVLARQRNERSLKQEISAMREKMHQSEVKPPAGYYDLKHGKGCITDIEFIVQYMVLCSACHYPALRKYTDTIRLIEQLAQHGLFSVEEATQLNVIYLTLRERSHHQMLQNLPAYILESEYTELRKFIIELKARLLESD